MADFTDSNLNELADLSVSAGRAHTLAEFIVRLTQVGSASTAAMDRFGRLVLQLFYIFIASKQEKLLARALQRGGNPFSGNWPLFYSAPPQSNPEYPWEDGHGLPERRPNPFGRHLIEFRCRR